MSDGTLEWEKFWSVNKQTIMKAFPEIASETKVGDLQKAIIRLCFQDGRISGLNAASMVFRETMSDA